MSGSGSFSVNTSNGVKIDGDDVELDYEVVSSAPSGVSKLDKCRSPLVCDMICLTKFI